MIKLSEETPVLSEFVYLTESEEKWSKFQSCLPAYRSFWMPLREASSSKALQLANYPEGIMGTVNHSPW